MSGVQLKPVVFNESGLKEKKLEIQEQTKIVDVQQDIN